MSSLRFDGEIKCYQVLLKGRLLMLQKAKVDARELALHSLELHAVSSYFLRVLEPLPNDAVQRDPCSSSSLPFDRMKWGLVQDRCLNLAMSM